MRRVDTYKKIFGNYLTLIDIHQQLYHELRNYQLYCQETVNGFIDEIGVILLKYISQFSDAYISYGSHFISAEYQVKKEMAHNDLFHDYIREKEKYPETRKLPFRHFIILPIIRLQRYPLLLEAILKRTDDHHSDKAHLIKVIKKIKEIASRMNKRTREIEQKLHLKEINDCIRFKPGKPTFDLHLDKPERTLIYEGLLKRRKHLGVETSDLYVFLFDHLLLMTKKTTATSARRSSDDHGTLMMMDVFTVSKNPIPLNLLNLKTTPTDSSVIGTIKSLTGSSSHSLFDTTLIDNNIYSKSSSTSSSTTLAEHQQNGTNQTLLTIQHLGRHGGDYVLSANSPNAQSVWREKILYAKREWDMKQTPAFEITSMSEFTFAQTGQANQQGRVTCSTRFGKYKQYINGKERIEMILI
jgi:hypothetical protein